MGTRSSAETTEIRTHIKNLKLTMGKPSSNGDDYIRLFELLTRFANNADTLNIS